ncbi:hypothetical protein B0H63DRAFT_132917 [Podospora didyma]|uniref:Heterokaryon incompatibility domain-containing protein n=1 Tax=Podospora didyma TaxID=330526 RepID=A0AAE0P0Q4_9PEZI|nr:hypothetical protein B0H63DRAFT_132917 [Podospora didyma]
MANEAVAQFEGHLARAHDYRESAQWEFMSRELKEAKSLCESPDFPDAARRRREVVGHLGSVERRLGRYELAQKLLEEVLDDEQTTDTQRLEVSGELSVVYRSLNNLDKARDICNEQYQVARRMALKGEEEMCRAIGNLGMANYQMSLQNEIEPDSELLQLAISQVEERVERARQLQEKLRREDPTSKTIRKARTWESIGLDRLTLCHAAAGNTAEAVRYGEMSRQMTKDSPDPTVRALSRFFYGQALLRDDQRDKAMEMFNYTAPDDQCTCAIALCKEPSDEYCEYLTTIVNQGVDLLRYDEQNYNALDYAVFADHAGMQEVILHGLRSTPNLAPDDIKQLLDGAHLKRHYKEIFQEHLRPELSRGGNNNSIQTMRVTYAKLLATDTEKKRLFDDFKFVPYSKFVGHGRLPKSTDKLAITFEDAAKAHHPEDETDFDPYVVFFSYRWIGRKGDPGYPCPDDRHDTQYKRMRNAIEDFLAESKMDPERIHIWLDWACIDQSNKDPGVNALPVIVTQCNAMVSLVDDIYFSRAWCAVEASLFQTLVNSHGQHQWYSHALLSQDPPTIITHSDGTVENNTDTVGKLDKCTADMATINPNDLNVSYESDKPRIAFLHKQSILLGKATSGS